jgi:hypothetical protein
MNISIILSSNNIFNPMDIFNVFLFIFVSLFPIRNNWYNLKNNFNSIYSILKFISSKSILYGFVILVSSIFGCISLGHTYIETNTVVSIAQLFIIICIEIQSLNTPKTQLISINQLIYITILARINILNIIISSDAIKFFIIKIFEYLKQIT